MKQKLLAIVLSLILVFGTASLAACGDKTGGDGSNGTTVTDTFEGVASETQYDDEETAVKAFLADEIGGKFTSYENKGALNAEKTAELAISDEDKKDIEAVYEVEITYEVSLDVDDEEEELTLFAEQSEEDTETYTRTHTVYVIKYKNGKCKYFSPCPKNGEAITRNYFKSLCDVSKYANCKAHSVIEHHFPDESVVKAEMTALISERAIKIESGYDSEDLPKNIVSYIFEHEETIYEVDKIYDDYQVIDLIYTDIDIYICKDWNDVITNYTLGFDLKRRLEGALHTLEKTDTGFKFTEMSNSFIAGLEMTSEGYVEVKDGKIVKIYLKASIYKDGAVINNQSYVIEVSDFSKIPIIEVPVDYISAAERGDNMSGSEL